MALVQDELSTGTRKTWAVPRLETIKMRNTAQVGKSVTLPECVVAVVGVDDPTNELCNLS